MVDPHDSTPAAANSAAVPAATSAEGSATAVGALFPAVPPPAVLSVLRSAFPLVGPEELAHQLAGDRPPVVLDVRWTLSGADREGYLAGHLPGAQFVDLDAHLAGQPGLGGRHPLPEPDVLQRFWRSVGIDDDSAVVVYDGSDSAPAARAWWLLRWSGIGRARVLDGGLAGWRSARLPVEHGPAPTPAPGSVVVRPGGMPTAEPDEVAALATVALAGAGGPVLLDARAANRYRGEIEPVDPVAGHIPGAVNLPYQGLLDDDRRFRSADEIRAAFAGVGVGPGVTARSGVADVRPDVAGLRSGAVAVASCGSGVTACLLVLAAATIGVNLALYPGSYSQWCALGREVATGG